MTSKSNGWQTYLKNDLQHRQSRNSGFSLRRYAQILGLSPSHLSSILTGKRQVTAKTALQLASSLGVTATETIEWMNVGPQTSAKVLRRELSDQEIAPTSEWYHFAILGLAHLKVNRADPSWIAQRLKISMQIAQTAFEELISVGHIEVKSGQFRQCSELIRTKDDIPSSIKKRYHRQVLSLSSEKIGKVPVELREYISMSVAIDIKRMAAAKKMLREFNEKFTTEISTGNKSEVYFFSMQFFPITEVQS